MPEEGVTTDSPSSAETLQRRLDRLEQDYMRENRWWRGGLITALVALAIVILVGAFHHRPLPPELGLMAMRGPMSMAGPMGMQGPMDYRAYPGYWPPPPPPPWAYGYGPGYGYGSGGGCDRHGWNRPGDRGPGGPDGPGAGGGGPDGPGASNGPPPPTSNG
jgi:hypothetical protein